jgi:hypothetical protein
LGDSTLFVFELFPFLQGVQQVVGDTDTRHGCPERFRVAGISYRDLDLVSPREISQAFWVACKYPNSGTLIDQVPHKASTYITGGACDQIDGTIIVRGRHNNSVA